LQVLFQTCLIALAAGILVVLLQDLIADIGFGLAGGTEDVKLWGRRYIGIRILAAPLVLLNFSITGFFRGDADRLSPLPRREVAQDFRALMSWGPSSGRDCAIPFFLDLQFPG
tara:strand:+ start:105 stop:443 length:339 start_codon:yes stop_codon:yes gene_type:complete